MLSQQNSSSNPNPTSTSPKKYRRHRNTNQFCGMKAILRQLFLVLQNSSMKVKNIAAEIVKIVNSCSKGEEFSPKTVQKRVYDVCLVLKTIGLLTSVNREVRLAEGSVGKINKNRYLSCEHLEKLVRHRTQAIKNKKLVLFRMHEALNLCRVLKKQRSKTEQKDPSKKLQLQNLLAVAISPENITLNDQLITGKITSVTLRNPHQILTNLQLLSRII